MKLLIKFPTRGRKNKFFSTTTLLGDFALSSSKPKIEFLRRVAFRNKNTNTELFNDSVIAYEKKSIKDVDTNEIIKDSINEKNMTLEMCSSLDINVKKPQELLFILCYLSFVSNKIRGLLFVINS